MPTYSFEGNTYYFRNGKWFDSHFVEVPMSIKSRLVHNFGKGRKISNHDSATYHHFDRHYQDIYILPGCFGAGKRR